MAEEPTEEPRIVFALQAPFRIRSINEAWLVEYGVTLGDCRVRLCVCWWVGWGDVGGIGEESVRAFVRFKGWVGRRDVVDTRAV